MDGWELTSAYRNQTVDLNAFSVTEASFFYHQEGDRLTGAHPAAALQLGLDDKFPAIAAPAVIAPLAIS